MKFSEYNYVRPNYNEIKEKLVQLTEKIRSAQSDEEALAAVKEIIPIVSDIDTQANLCSIRHSIDTRDEFYDKESAFWDEYSPLFQELMTDYYTAVLDSPYRAAIEKLLPKTFFLRAENSRKIFSPDVIELMQKENELANEYQKLIASAQIEFQGQVYTLPQMGPFTQSTDAQVRRAAMKAHAGFFAENEATIDRIFDELVKTRDAIAKKLGFKDYVEYGYLLMNRFDYSREDVQRYREEIRKYVVPVVQKLHKRQAKRLGLEHLSFYDAGIEFLDGNAIPQGDPDYILEQGIKMYHEMSPETKEFFDFMVEHNLLDLVSKPGKQGGGYCTYIADYKSPFVFSNFNGTSGDVDVLTHEMGHAFQVYSSRWVPTPECVWPTYESCEIHSMSMEFFAWPWMEGFFKHQKDKYLFSHLSGTLLFLPYGVLVDHFQHEVYEHPEMTPAERKAKWRELEKMYLPDRDYEDLDILERGAYWFRQAHIFVSPFYYIDYTLAQVCALQFWKRTIVDHDPKAWEDYLRICKLGGTATFLEIVEAANLRSPFTPGALGDTIEAADRYLESVDDQAL